MRNEVNLHCDGQSAGIIGSTFSRINLTYPDVMRRNRQPLQFGQALALAASQCAQCERCESDIRTKLLDWGMTDDETESIMARLKSDNYINEDRYAAAYARDKFAFNGWGRQKIAYMLKSKGIGGEAINTAIAGISDDDCRQALLRLLKAKARSLKGREPQSARAALLRLAACRGYEARLFFPIVDHVMSSAGDNDDD